MTNDILKERILFFTPIYDVELTDIDNIFLKNYLQNLQGSDSVKRLINDTGYQTRNFDSEKDLTLFFDRIKPLINSISLKWGIEKELKLVNWWGAVNNRYDYGESHYHYEGIISGVYYIKAPTNCGSIIFERPDLQEVFFRGDTINEYNYQTYSYEPKENLLVLFPSYIRHHIEQNRTPDTDDSRICIAFNFG